MKKRCWVLRPIAWGCAMLMSLGMDIISGLIFRLGTELVFWLSGLSTLVVIFLVMALGSIYLGLVTYSAWIVPSILVYLSDAIYPSNHAFRYYFIGIFQMIGCVFCIIAAARGLLVQDIMFFLYANMVHLAVSALVMMFLGRGKSEERHKEETK